VTAGFFKCTAIGVVAATISLTLAGVLSGSHCSPRASLAPLSLQFAVHDKAANACKQCAIRYHYNYYCSRQTAILLFGHFVL
jgi:hypothetical protein